MRSTASLFNKTLFSKDIKRLWPIWVVFSIIASLIGFAYSTGIRNNLAYYYNHPINLDARYTYYSIVSSLMPISAMILACIVTASVWGYLYTTRSTVFFHTIPVSRTGLFFTNLATTFVITIIPMLVAWLTFTTATITMGLFDPKGMFVSLLAMIAETLTMVSISTLCAQLTGRLAIFVLLDLSSNLFFAVAEELFSSFSVNFLYGVGSTPGIGLYVLSPVVGLINKLNPTNRESGAVRLEGYPIIVIYAAVALVLIAVAYLAYLSRKSEAATEVVAFKALKPVLLYSYAILGAVFFTWFFYDLTDNYNHQVYDLLKVILLMILFSTVMYFVGRMIIDRSVKVLKPKYLPGYIVMTALLVVFCFVMSKDPLGYVERTPDAEDVSSLYVNSSLGDIYLNEKDLGLIEYATDLQKTIATEGERKLNDELPEDYFNFTYMLKNGTRINREYRLNLYRENMNDKNSIESKVDEFYNLEPVLEKKFHLGGEFTFESATVYVTYYENDQFEKENEKYLTESEGLKLREALLEDLQAGRINRTDIFANGAISSEDDLMITIDLCSLVDTGRKYTRGTDMMLNAVVVDSGLAYGTYTTFPVDKSMTSTYEFLDSLGILQR